MVEERTTGQLAAKHPRRAPFMPFVVDGGWEIGLLAPAGQQVAPAVAGRAKFTGSNRAVKWRSRLGWETIRMPGRPEARCATRSTTSIT